MFQHLFNKFGDSCDVTCCQGRPLAFFCSLRKKKLNNISKTSKGVSVHIFHGSFTENGLSTLLHFAFVYSFPLVKVLVLYILKVLTTYYKNIYFGI